jgi:MarR family transcriptional regulator, organic hydroperoxide resistance regulator
MDELPEEEQLRETAEKIHPIYVPTGVAFKKILWAFERDVGISPPKYFVLHILTKEEHISQGEISRLSGVDPSRVTQLAKLLEGEGLIERTRDPEDNRVVRMHLTSEGRRAFEMAAERSKVFRNRVRRALNEEEHRELRRLLGKLTAEMED